jgi:hypothetical protein
LRVDQKTVSSINAVGPSYHRVEFKAVDGGSGAITIADNGPKEIAGKTLVVAPQAGITIDGAAAKLAGVPIGAFVNLGLTTDFRTVLHLQAEGPTLAGCGGSEASAIDAVNHTVTFAARGPAEVAGKTFRIAQNVGLQMDGRPGKLADLPAGSYLNIPLAVDRQTVRSIWATGPPVPGFGVVKAVDAANRTVTVDDRTYPVAPNANIVMADRGGLAARLDLQGHTFPNLLGETAHRLMLVEAATLPSWAGGKILNPLKQQPSVIHQLTLFQTAVDAVLQSSIRVFPVPTRVESPEEPGRGQSGG